MTTEDFLFLSPIHHIPQANFTWQAPSNIALVKYWGKKQDQIPANPSLSFTLNNCITTTSIDFRLKDKGEDAWNFEIFFEGEKKVEFRAKIETFLNRIDRYCPYLKGYELTIRTKNSFPHSSGIASSASGMSALALCIMNLEKELSPEMSDSYFFQKASFLARLGSGSACRSVEGPLVVWGKHGGIGNSSNLYGTPYNLKVHPVFEEYRDTILLVDKGTKQVSSSVGHDLMHDHPYAEARFQQAHKNLEELKRVFETGDLQRFISIVESEALSLHAMMMSSNPYFILMKPNTLEIINKIWDFRKETGLPVCFTLDAGANVHVLYPKKEEHKIFEFIKNELVVYCEKEQYLCDAVGMGAKKL